MPQGGCFCEKVRVNLSGEPSGHVLCHCLDCRKISGTSYSNNLIVGEDQFKVQSGTPKQISKVADSGKKITSHFCGDCGTTLFRTGDSFPGSVIIKSGILDDPQFPNNNIPKGELFVDHRPTWVAPIDGADQLKGMP